MLLFVTYKSLLYKLHLELVYLLVRLQNILPPVTFSRFITDKEREISNFVWELHLRGTHRLYLQSLYSPSIPLTLLMTALAQ